MRSFAYFVLWLLCGTAGVRVDAQVPAQDFIPQAIVSFSDAELDQLLGPIALYPDPLIAQLLPAATQPAEITLADRYLQGGGDPNQVDLQPWTAAVKAMAHYPEIIKWLDDNLAWTTQVGQAFQSQPDQVMDSIQRLRAQAQGLGNLQSNAQQTVQVDNGEIEIAPTNPEVIYVPVYQPSVVYSQPPAYGVSPYISFGIGLPVGIWLNHDWDWRDHRLIVWNRDHFRPRDWWYRPARERFSPGVVHNEFHDWRLRQHGVSSNNRVEDRGWGSRPRQSTPVRIPETQPRRTEPFHSAEPERRANPPAQPARPEPRREQPPMNGAPPPRSTTTTRAPWSAAAPQPNGALVGAHSAREARDYSNRGQQSRQIGAVPSRGGIGGGGPTRSFGGRNQQRH